VGVSKRYRIYVTSILNLSEEAQDIIRKNGLTERMVRPISQKLRKYPDLQVQVLNRILAWQTEGEDGPGQPLAASVDALVDRLVVREEQGAQSVEAITVPKEVSPRQLHLKIQAMLRVLDQLGEPEMMAMAESLANSEANKVVVDDLQELEQRLDKLLDEIEVRQKDEIE
jgi:hypothetical protein